jgi:hypothetical protein
MRDKKLCPVCRLHYFDLTVTDNGNLVYWHYEFEKDGKRHVKGCQLTENSKIRGIKFDRQ